MTVVKALTGIPICLGRQGEQDTTQVVFDLRDFIECFGEGTAVLVVERPGDPRAYAAVLRRDGANAVWEIGAQWTQNAGYGRCQLSWLVGTAVAKSAEYRLQVLASMGEGEDAPAPDVSYLNQILAAGTQALTAADRAEAAAIRQPVIQNGTWWVWAADAGMYVDTGTPAQADGEVFVAEYGKTTFAELEEAYGKYKVLFCREDNYLSPMYSRTPGVNMCFYRNNADVTINAFCKPDGWHKSVRHLCEEALGDIETALDRIIDIQNSLMGGDGE